MHTSRLLAAVVVALLSAQTQPTFAHHSYAMFDMTKSVTLEGTIKEVQWTNPHIWVQILAPDPSTGQEVEWSIEGAGATMLTRNGWSRGLVKPGDKAVMVVHPVKAGGKGNSGSLGSLTVNGQRIFGGRNPAQPAEAK
jgi:hypothetical protein